MSKVDFSQRNFQRKAADGADLILRNRYFEQNPALNPDGATLLARPGLRYWTSVGTGPIRGVHSEAGAFKSDLFVASGDTLYRVTKGGVKTVIQANLYEPEKGFVKMVIAAAIGSTPERLFFTDGRNLFCYNGTTCVPVLLPNDDACIDIALISSYIIVIPVQDTLTRGMFYWIEPGDVVIDPLNFATAESAADAILQVAKLGDNYYLCGESTTEVWYVTGDGLAPMQRLQGVVFDRGTWEQTGVVINEVLVVVDSEGGVFGIRGGSPKRVSTPDIEEVIRKAIQFQQRTNL